MLKNKDRQNFLLQSLVLLASFGVFAAKLTAWLLTDSLSIMADALESIVNIIVASFSLFSIRLSRLPSDVNHPYGHGKIEFISASLEGALVLGAGFYIIIQALLSFVTSYTVLQLQTGILLLLATALINFFLGFGALRIGRKNQSIALQASGKHLMLDAYSSLAITVGLGLIYLSGLIWLDLLIALLAGGYIIFNGWLILRHAVAGMMDEADLSLLQQLVNFIADYRSQNWVDLHNLRIIKYGARLHLDCHLTVPWYFNLLEAHKEIDRLQTLVNQAFGTQVEIFVHSDGCTPKACPICPKQDCNFRQQRFVKPVKWTCRQTSCAINATS